MLSSTFEVSKVQRATQPLPEVPYAEAIKQSLSQALLRKERRLREDISALERMKIGFFDRDTKKWLKSEKQQLATIEAEKGGVRRRVEACSRYHGRLVAEVSLHPIISSLHRAFNQHRPLCLSPDMFWLLICQGVAHHVNANAETLRSRFVQHQGKARIEIRRDDFIKGSPENPWGEVIDEFSRHVGGHIGPVHDLFLPRFSTTGPTERIAAEIVLLDAMKSYFEYILHTMCGIPAITLEGTVQDWQELANRAQSFAQFDLEWWITHLTPILREFVAAARGDVRPEFWESIYKFNSFSGGASITGWITAFFPYFTDAQGNATRKNRWLASGGGALELLLSGNCDPKKPAPEGPALGSFPSGLASAPFMWNYMGQSYPMEFLGGFVGIAQDPATLTLRPEIGWAVRQG